ncbi:MAG: ArsB/NhaD family transporter [Fusobacteriaceae bacterium]
MLLIIALLIFVSVFYCIITEKIPNAWATMTGGLLMTLIGILEPEQALSAIAEKFDIIFLLVGMMIIVNLISETGIFQWFAIKLAQFAKGEPFLVIALLALMTAVASAFLDNVTTILLLAPVSVVLAKQLKLNPFVFIMAEAMSANIGGAATLIGDPTNLIIGHGGKLSFNDFLFNTSPLAIIAFCIMLLNIYFFHTRKLKVTNELRAQIMELDASRAIKDKKLLKVAGTIFGIVIFAFIFDSFFHKGLQTWALLGAMLLVIFAKRKSAETLEHVEWDTLFFFMGLFMMVRGIQEVHAIEYVGEFITKITNGKFEVSVISISWISAISTSLIGNVATATTFGEIIKSMSATFVHAENLKAFWWALSFGACLGANTTILASAANIVAVSTAAKVGVKISFFQFMKFAISVTLQTLFVSSIYLWVRYLM